MAMKFYQASRATRIALTAINVAVAVCGAFLLFHGRWMGVAFVSLGSVQIYSLWNSYLEIAVDGMLRSKGYGFDLMFPVADLRYAGRVREKQNFPVSERKDIELEVAGAREKRYVRVADRPAFLQQLQRVAPQAEIVPV